MALAVARFQRILFGLVGPYALAASSATDKSTTVGRLY